MSFALVTHLVSASFTYERKIFNVHQSDDTGRLIQNAIVSRNSRSQERRTPEMDPLTRDVANSSNGY